MIRAIIAATLLTTPAYAGGLAPEPAPKPQVRSQSFTACPPHTPWTMCQGERDGERDGPTIPSPQRPPVDRVPPVYPVNPVDPVTPVDPVKPVDPPVKEPPTPKPCLGGAPGGC